MSDASQEDERLNQLVVQAVQERVSGPNNQRLIMQKVREQVEQRRLQIEKDEELER